MLKSSCVTRVSKPHGLLPIGRVSISYPLTLLSSLPKSFASVVLFARSSQYSVAPTLRGSLFQVSTHDGRFLFTASNVRPHFAQASTASFSSFPVLHVHRIKAAPFSCSDRALKITPQRGRPISGYLFSQSVPSKSIAITFCIVAPFILLPG